MESQITRNLQYYKFCLYGFLKNLRFFDAFLLIYLMDKGLIFSLIGALYAIREISLAVFEIPSGIVADALGRRKVLVTSFLFYIISFLVFYWADHFALFVIAMLLFALGDAFRTGVHKAMIYHYLAVNKWSHQKVNYYGHTRSWSQIGTAFSALIAGLAVFITGNYRIIFIASVVPYFLDMILVWSYPAYLDKTVGDTKNKSVRHTFKNVLNAFIISFTKLDFIRALTSSSLYTGYYRAIKDYIQPLIKYFALTLPFLAYLSNEKKVAVFVGLIYFITYLLTAFASRSAARLSDLFKSDLKPLNLTILTGFIIGIITGVAFRYGFFIASIAGFIIILIIENLRKPAGVAVVADLSKDSALATVLSAGSQAKSLITAVLAPILGLFADIFDPGTAITIVSIVLLFSFPLYWLRNRISIQ